MSRRPPAFICSHARHRNKARRRCKRQSSTSPQRSSTRTARPISATPMRCWRPTRWRASSASTASDVFFLTGHRRARPQDAADRREGGPDAAGARRPQLGRLSRSWWKRSGLRPTISSARRRSATTAPARKSGVAWRLPATSISTTTPAGIRFARSSSSTRRRPRSAPTACAANRWARRSNGWRRRATSSASRPIRTGCSRTTRRIPTSSARTSAATRW